MDFDSINYQIIVITATNIFAIRRWSGKPQMKLGNNSSHHDNHMEAELRLTLEEIARLQNALAEANMKIIALQASIESSNNNIEEKKQFNPIIQELRQPIHTIQGYLDLLSNESVGILGTFQKRFIERIADAVIEIEKTLDTLEVDQNSVVLEKNTYSKVFSLTSVLEETLALFSDLIRTRLVTLKLDFESEEIFLSNDQEKLEKILNILFTNCCTTIEKEGTCTLLLKVLQGKKPSEVMISIQSNDHDSGKAKPLPVNLKEFKDPQTKLEGFGSDLGELAKANNLLEEMHGNMEIFSVPANGSLIRIRLPMTAK